MEIQLNIHYYSFDQAHIKPLINFHHFYYKKRHTDRLKAWDYSTNYIIDILKSIEY